MGDFNYDDVNWDEDGGSCRGKGKKASLEMLEKIGADFLIQNVHMPTFGANTLDLVFTESPDRISNIKIGPPFISSTKNRLHSTLRWEYNLVRRDIVKFSSDTLIYKRGDYKGFNLEKIEMEAKEGSVNDIYK